MVNTLNELYGTIFHNKVAFLLKKKSSENFLGSTLKLFKMTTESFVWEKQVATITIDSNFRSYYSQDKIKAVSDELRLP